MPCLSPALLRPILDAVKVHDCPACWYTGVGHFPELLSQVFSPDTSVYRCANFIVFEEEMSFPIRRQGPYPMAPYWFFNDNAKLYQHKIWLQIESLLKHWSHALFMTDKPHSVLGNITEKATCRVPNHLPI